MNYKLVDGDNTGNPELVPIRRRAWEHDYFTAALPFAQKGEPVMMPIAGNVTLQPLEPGNYTHWRDPQTLNNPAGTGAVSSAAGGLNYLMMVQLIHH